MSPSSDRRIAEFYAQTYDESVPDWPGEIDFYRNLAAQVRQRGQSLLELACGTGRVAIQLARDGTHVVGLDISPEMLQIAASKSAGMPNVRWVQANMCSPDLGETFGLILIPGHAFQNLNSAPEQVACLTAIRQHLAPDGTVVIHLDHADVLWLGELMGEKGGVFKPAEEFIHPVTGRRIRTARAWAYERATQTAICTTAWEAVDANGRVIDRWQTELIRLHCVFRFEMEHLLARAGLVVEALYGDFYRHPLDDSSSDMIWVAHP